MARIKSRKQKREEAQMAIYQKENSISVIVSVLRLYNSHKLWNKTKYEWTLLEWEEYFKLKSK